MTRTRVNRGFAHEHRLQHLGLVDVRRGAGCTLADQPSGAPAFFGTGFEPAFTPAFTGVRVHLGAISDGVQLRVGTTASVMVHTGTAEKTAP